MCSKKYSRWKLVAGNPARIISTIDLYQVKIKDNCFNIAGLNTMEKKNTNDQ